MYPRFFITIKFKSWRKRKNGDGKNGNGKGAGKNGDGENGDGENNGKGENGDGKKKNGSWKGLWGWKICCRWKKDSKRSRIPKRDDGLWRRKN